MGPETLHFQRGSRSCETGCSVDHTWRSEGVLLTCTFKRRNPGIDLPAEPRRLYLFCPYGLGVTYLPGVTLRYKMGLLPGLVELRPKLLPIVKRVGCAYSTQKYIIFWGANVVCSQVGCSQLGCQPPVPLRVFGSPKPRHTHKSSEKIKPEPRYGRRRARPSSTVGPNFRWKDHRPHSASPSHGASKSSGHV